MTGLFWSFGIVQSDPLPLIFSWQPYLLASLVQYDHLKIAFLEIPTGVSTIPDMYRSYYIVSYFKQRESCVEMTADPFISIPEIMTSTVGTF